MIVNINLLIILGITLSIGFIGFITVCLCKAASWAEQRPENCVKCPFKKENKCDEEIGRCYYEE